MDHRLIFQTANVTETYSVRHEYDEWKSGEESEYKQNQAKKDVPGGSDNICEN
jgi:hypothetical protein